MAGGFGLPTRRRSPAASRRASAAGSRRSRPRRGLLLLVASAEPIGDPVPVWRAAGALGVEPAARGAAADLVEFGGQVRFRHPLVRSRSTGRHRRRSASARTARWPTRRTRKSILTGAPGTARTRPRRPTRTLPPSSSARPAAHRAAVAWPGRGLSRARSGADPRARPPCPPCARRGAEQAARRRTGCRAAAPRPCRGRAAR